MSGWLGNDRGVYKSLGDAYSQMYNKTNDEVVEVKEETDGYVIIDEYAVSEENAIALEEGKKKCKEGYKYDSDTKKCVKKEKKSSSNTTIIVGRGYGHGGHHDHDDDKEDGNDGGDGGSGGGGDGGGGGE